MELPKNITQIGETNPHCKVYVEDYVISYIKQLNQYAGEKEMAVALYGVRKEEEGITYLFLYGACRLVFLQKECRHLSQAVQQEAEKQRRKFFPDTVFLGYRMLDGEMVEGFHICEQGVCRYVEGYARFYEKNDAMLAFMLEERQEASKPEVFDQEKYNVVKRRQEERRTQAEEKDRHAKPPKRGPAPETASAPVGAKGRLTGMKLTAAAVFTVLCVTGLAAMGDGERLEEWQMALRQLVENMSEQQLPDMVQVSNGTAQVGTIVAEDKLTDAILQENEAASPGGSDQGQVPDGSAGAEQDQSGSQGTGQGQGGNQGTGQGQGGNQGTSQGQDQGGNQGTSQGQDQSGSQGTGQGQGGNQGASQGQDQSGSQGTGQGQPGNQGTGQGQGGNQGTSQGQDQSGSQGTGQGQGGNQGTSQGQDQSGNQDSGQGQPGSQGQQSGQGSDGQPSQPPSGQAEQPAQGGEQTDESQPASGPAAELVAYTVQRGDTLIGICVKRYGSDARVSEICSLNKIENPDDIKVGEKIFLPQ